LLVKLGLPLMVRNDKPREGRSRGRRTKLRAFRLRGLLLRPPREFPSAVTVLLLPS
jgi:hypothetical protein